MWPKYGNFLSVPHALEIKTYSAFFKRDTLHMLISPLFSCAFRNFYTSKPYFSVFLFPQPQGAEDPHHSILLTWFLFVSVMRFCISECQITSNGVPDTLHEQRGVMLRREWIYLHSEKKIVFAASSWLMAPLTPWWPWRGSRGWLGLSRCVCLTGSRWCSLLA